MDVPVSVQAYSGERLAEQGVTQIQDIDRISPAASFLGGYGPDATSFYIRGIGSLTLEGGLQTSVGLVIDGVPVARATEFISDLGDIERVEVLSGPQGTLFGKNTTAGVINIITRRPEDKRGASFEGFVTHDTEVYARTTINLPVGEDLALRGSAFYHYQDPLVNNEAGPDSLGLRSWGFQLKALAKFSETTTLLLSGLHTKMQSSFGEGVVIIPLNATQAALIGTENYGRNVDRVNNNGGANTVVKNSAFTAQLDAELGDSLSLVSVTSYRDVAFGSRADPDRTPLGGVAGIGYAGNPATFPVAIPIYAVTSQNLNDNTFGSYKYGSQEIRLNYVSDSLDVILGAFGQLYKERRSFTNGATFVVAAFQSLTSADLQAKLKDNTVAGFIDATYSITPTLKVFGGLRYTYEELELDYRRLDYFTPLTNYDILTNTISAAPRATTAFKRRRVDNQLSGRAGIQWQPTPFTNIYLSYARGYKGPGANMATGTTAAATALLEPEIANAVELGIKQRLFDERLLLTGSVYYQQVNDIQQAAIIPGVVASSLINAGDIRTKGFEFSAFARPTSGLTLSAGVVYNDARYRGDAFFFCGPSGGSDCFTSAGVVIRSLNGKPAIGSPKWKTVLTADYELPVADDLKMKLHAGYIWRSAVQDQLYQDPLTRRPALGLADASISLGDPDDRWTATVFVKNIFDKFNYNNLATSGFIATSFGYLPRDYKRYGGLRIAYRY